MALLGLGGKGLRERLIRQYGILPPGSIGQTLFDEIIPTVLVDDLTKGLILDENYRAPGMATVVKSAVALENGYCGLTARAGVMILVEKIEVRFGTAGGGALNIGPSDVNTGSPAFWRDRRLNGSPSALPHHGSRVGLTGTSVMNIRAQSSSFTTFELDMILTPTSETLESTISVWAATVNITVDVNFFWREILVV